MSTKYDFHVALTSQVVLENIKNHNGPREGLHVGQDLLAVLRGVQVLLQTEAAPQDGAQDDQQEEGQQRPVLSRGQC